MQCWRAARLRGPKPALAKGGGKLSYVVAPGFLRQYMVSDKPVWLKSRLDALRSRLGLWAWEQGFFLKYMLQGLPSACDGWRAKAARLGCWLYLTFTLHAS